MRCGSARWPFFDACMVNVIVSFRGGCHCSTSLPSEPNTGLLLILLPAQDAPHVRQMMGDALVAVDAGLLGGEGVAACAGGTHAATAPAARRPASCSA